MEAASPGGMTKKPGRLLVAMFLAIVAAAGCFKSSSVCVSSHWGRSSSSHNSRSSSSSKKSTCSNSESGSSSSSNRCPGGSSVSHTSSSIRHSRTRSCDCNSNGQDRSNISLNSTSCNANHNSSSTMVLLGDVHIKMARGARQVAALAQIRPVEKVKQLANVSALFQKKNAQTGEKAKEDAQEAAATTEDRSLRSTVRTRTMRQKRRHRVVEYGMIGAVMTAVLVGAVIIVREGPRAVPQYIPDPYVELPASLVKQGKERAGVVKGAKVAIYRLIGAAQNLADYTRGKMHRIQYMIMHPVQYFLREKFHEGLAMHLVQITLSFVGIVLLVYSIATQGIFLPDAMSDQY